MSDTNGEKKVKELASIHVEAWGDWAGERFARDIRTGDGKTKFTVGLPVPKTDEEADSLYGIPLAFLIRKGVKQHSYDSDSNLANKIADALKAGQATSDMPAMVADTLENDMIFTEKEKKASEASALKQAKTELNMSLTDMIEFIKAHK